jgi:hypothetical protein
VHLRRVRQENLRGRLTMRPLAIDLYCGLGVERECSQCGSPFAGRSNKQFCSTKCYQRHWYNRPPFPYERECRCCGVPFIVSARDDANRQYCGKACAKLAQRKGSIAWLRLHPEKPAEYGRNAKKKNTHVWRDRRRKDRTTILELLGGKCIVCGTRNPAWLHVDYIPTSKNERHRHSRTLKFVLANIQQFRLLCANHHYELTLTGKIEGTDIVQ